MRFRNTLYTSFTLLLLFVVAADVPAQAVLSANSNSGGAYNRIRSQRFQIEGPDRFSQGSCNGNNAGDHSGFGNHITQVFDSQLNKNVFAFHSHINRDSDRCMKFDRVRIEVKGMPGDNIHPEIRHTNGSESWYRFQFKLPSNFKGSTNFSHLFQNKATGGPDDGFPLITISARTTFIEVRHDAGENMSADKGRMVSADINKFKGKWVEVYMRQKHSNNGTFYVKISDMSTGATILEHRDNNIDLWRRGAQINRPKFGIYRRITSEAQDEVVRFAGFCSSESAASRCPSMIQSGGGGSLSGTYYFRNRATGQYLDSDGSGRVKAGSFSTNNDRRWRLVLSNSSRQDYNIDSRQSGRGVLEAGSNGSVKYVGAEPVQTADRREWNVESLGNNRYRFKNREKNRYLAQKNGSSGIEYTTWNGNRAQWELVSVSGNNLTTSTDEPLLGHDFQISPNPITDDFVVTTSGQVPATLALFSIDGKRVFETALTTQRRVIQRPIGLPAGVYVARITDAEGLVSNQRVILK